MDIVYIDALEPDPIQIDEDYYSSPAPKIKPKVVESRVTLEDFELVSRNTNPVKVCMVEIASLRQIQERYK
jgi:hypothetical protein